MFICKNLPRDLRRSYSGEDKPTALAYLIFHYLFEESFELKKKNHHLQQHVSAC